MTEWLEDDELYVGEQRWPLAPNDMLPRERWLWWEQLWSDVCALRVRYRLALRSGWWDDQVQVEALAALAAWVERYDSGEWDDPPGKLACSTTSSAWRRCCAVSANRFTPTAIVWRSRGF
jgi:hypothetical protein